MIDILGILLPALIILVSITRIFAKNTKGMNGLTIFFAVLLLVGGTIRFLFFSGNSGGTTDSGTQQESLRVSKHSEGFNQSVGKILNAYYKMTESFVNWDTTAVNSSGMELKGLLDSLNLEELKRDTTGIYESATDPLTNAKTEVAAILADPSIAEKRGSLNILSDNLRLLLTAVKYDRAVLYWQECPMAFGEERPGNWISQSKEVRNPYLGTKDPQYGSKMLNCGAPKYTIAFDPPADSTKKQ